MTNKEIAKVLREILDKQPSWQHKLEAVEKLTTKLEKEE